LNPWKKLQAQVLREHVRHQGSMMAAFNLLERLDPELAALIIEVMRTREAAAAWTASTVAGLGDRMPYALLAEDDRGGIIHLLMESLA
jgi:hypothetical protein